MITVKEIVPSAEEVAELFETLLGRDMRATPSDPLLPRRSAVTTVAEFEERRRRCHAIWVSDFPLSCSAGAALVLMNLEALGELKSIGKMDPALLENYREVLNVGASIFSRDSSLSMQLTQVYVTPRVLPSQVVYTLIRAEEHLGLRLEVPEYGGGCMSLYVRPLET